MKYPWTRTLILAASVAIWTTPTFAVVVLYEENFDSLLPTLGGSVNERIDIGIATRVATDPDSMPIPGVWSATGPVGWTTDHTLNSYDGSPTTKWLGRRRD